MPKVKSVPIDGGYVIPKDGFSTWVPKSACNVEGETYEDGYFIFPEGTVEAYSQGGPRFSESSRLTAFYQGKIYSRCFQKRYSRRHLKTLARQFLHDVIQKVKPVFVLNLDAPELQALQPETKYAIQRSIAEFKASKGAKR